MTHPRISEESPKFFAKLGIRTRGELGAVLGPDQGADPGLPDSTMGPAPR